MPWDIGWISTAAEVLRGRGSARVRRAEAPADAWRRLARPVRFAFAFPEDLRDAVESCFPSTTIRPIFVRAGQDIWRAQATLVGTPSHEKTESMGRSDHDEAALRPCTRPVTNFGLWHEETFRRLR